MLLLGGYISLAFYLCLCLRVYSRGRWIFASSGSFDEFCDNSRLAEVRFFQHVVLVWHF